MRFGAVHHATREQHGARGACADASHEQRRHHGGADAKVHFWIAKFRLGVRDGKVARHHQAASATDGRTANAGDGWNGEATQR
jgi:hypothetical protein